jgi:hypothetical protein
MQPLRARHHNKESGDMTIALSRRSEILRADPAYRRAIRSREVRRLARHLLSTLRFFADFVAGLPEEKEGGKCNGVDLSE